MITQAIDVSMALAPGVYTKLVSIPELALSSNINIRLLSKDLTRNSKIRVANCPNTFVEGTTPPQNHEWLQPLDLILGPGGIRIGIMEDTGVVLRPGRCIVVYSETDCVNAHAHGYVKDASQSLAGLTQSMEANIHTLAVDVDARFTLLNTNLSANAAAIAQEVTDRSAAVNSEALVRAQAVDAERLARIAADQSEASARNTALTLEIMNRDSAIAAAIAGLSSGGAGNLPAGCIIYTAAQNAPAGTLKANGAIVSRTTYAALFNEIGTFYGAGDGTTTFQLPALGGLFIRSLDDGAGIDVGRARGSVQLDALQGHAHSGSYNGFNDRSGGSGGTPNLRNDGATQPTGGAVTDGINGVPRTAAETRPRNIALLACITLGTTPQAVPFVFNSVISSDTLNYDLRAAAVSAGWDQSKPLSANVTIANGIVVGSSTTAGYAFDTGSVFPSGSTLSLTNNGTISGAGGAGGNGGLQPSPGQAGGVGLRAQYAISVTNNGVVQGGGGGANGSAISQTWSGGGGGAGRTVGAPGQAGGGNGNPYAGAATLTTGGIGYTGDSAPSGSNGGAPGQPGAAGDTFAAKAGGAALVGLSYVNSGSGLAGTVRGAQQ